MGIDPNSFEGMIAAEDVALLQRVAREIPEGAIVEIGAYRGKSAIALALAARDRLYAGKPLVYSIEPHAEFVGVYGGRFGAADRAAYYRAVTEAGCGQEIALIALPSVQAAKAWDAPIALLFIDGDHTLDGVRADVAAWLPFVVRGGMVIFDDAHDPGIGPFVVVSELLAGGAYEIVATTSKMRVLRRIP